MVQKVPRASYVPCFKIRKNASSRVTKAFTDILVNEKQST